MSLSSPVPLTFWMISLLLVVAARAEVTWLYPSAGQSVPKGSSIQASWTSTPAIISPSFRLCSSSSTCGTAIWPTVTTDTDGISHISVSAPPMDADSPFFLIMRGDDMQTFPSPSFTLLAGITPQGTAGTAPMQSAEVSQEEFGSLANDDEAAPPTASLPAVPDSVDPFHSVALPSADAAVPTDATLPLTVPILTPQPFFSTVAMPQASSSVAVQAAEATVAPKSLNVKAIVFPIVAVAVICLAALIFLLRKKSESSKASPSSVAAATDLEKAVSGSMTEKERTKSIYSASGSEFGDYQHKGSLMPTLGKYGRSSYGSPDSYASGDTYTSSPTRRGSFQASPPLQHLDSARYLSVPRSSHHIQRPMSAASMRSSDSHDPRTYALHHSRPPIQSPYDSYRSRAGGQTPVYLPSRMGSPEDDHELNILSFPWSHTPYTPSVAPPYLPTLRQDSAASSPRGREPSSDHLRRSDTHRQDRRPVHRSVLETPGSVYSQAETLIGREKDRRREMEREMERERTAKAREKVMQRERLQEREREYERERERDRQRGRDRQREREEEKKAQRGRVERDRRGESQMEELYSALSKSLQTPR